MLAIAVIHAVPNNGLTVKIEGELSGVALTIKSSEIPDTVRVVGADMSKRLVGNKLIAYVRFSSLVIIPKSFRTPIEITVNPKFPVELELDMINSELHIEGRRLKIKSLDISLKSGQIRANFYGVRPITKSEVKLFTNFATVILDHLEQLDFDELQVSSELSKFRFSFNGFISDWRKIMFNGSFNSIQVEMPSGMSFIVKDRGFINMVAHPPDGRISFKLVLGGLLNRLKVKTI